MHVCEPEVLCIPAKYCRRVEFVTCTVVYTFSQAMELVADFRHSTGPTKFVLPLKDSELESRQDIIYLLV